MVINIIGDCDKRPVLFTVLKVCQALGDVLLITNSTRLSRLSDTGETYGHYQNIMIAVTTETIDDFLDDFSYGLNSFAYTVVDNIVLAEADLYIYVEGIAQTENEIDNLEYIEDYKTVRLYSGKLTSGSVLRNLERFEALRDCCPIGKSVAEAVAKVVAPNFNMEVQQFVDIAMQYNPSPDTSGKRSVGTKNKGVKIPWLSK